MDHFLLRVIRSYLLNLFNTIMKFFATLITTCSLLFFANFSFGQTSGADTTSTDSEQEIKTLLDDYWVATQASDWNTVLDFMYPKIFDYVPRETMLEVMGSLNDDEVKVRFTSVDVKKVSEPYTHENERYALVHYDMVMTMIFPAEEDQEDFNSFMLGIFEAQYGKKNVNLNDDNTFDIKVENSMYVIADVGSSDWKLLENKTEQQAMLDMMIPKKVQKQLDKLTKS